MCASDIRFVRSAGYLPWAQIFYFSQGAMVVVAAFHSDEWGIRSSSRKQDL